MAILFVSRTKKHRALFWTISGLVIVVFALISFAAFPYEFFGLKKVSSDVGSLPDLNVNVDILDSDTVKGLEPFSDSPPSNEMKGRSEPFKPY